MVANLKGKGEFLYMKYDKNKFTLNTVIMDVAMDIYSTNKDYFKMSSGEEPNMESVIRDKIEIPPNSILENKNYKLISIEGNHIGIIDYIESYPDEDAVYIGLLMIHKDFQGLGHGSN